MYGILALIIKSYTKKCYKKNELNVYKTQYWTEKNISSIVRFKCYNFIRVINLFHHINKFKTIHWFFYFHSFSLLF